MDGALNLPLEVGLKGEGREGKVLVMCGQSTAHWLTAALRTRPTESKEGEDASSGPCASLQPVLLPQGDRCLRGTTETGG